MKAHNNVSWLESKVTHGFWQARQALNREATIWAVLARFQETGRFDAFRCDWRHGQPHKPHIFWDSDVAKWVESAAYLLAEGPDARLEEAIEGVIDLIERHQQPDGYFNIHFTAVDPAARFSDRSQHELYCAGHLIEAAVAYAQATGRERFVRLMARYVALIERVFCQERSAAFATPGHQEIELALVRLYQHTNERRYLALAEWFIDQRGANAIDDRSNERASRAHQDHLPCAEQTTAEGHAVRAGYLYSAMADIARLRGDEALRAACQRLFDNIALRRMYVTGGVGSSRYSEAFTIDWDLQNEIAYTETCASIALVFFAQRMLLIDPDGKYADVAETALYNGILCGLSLDGTKFYYTNPMEVALAHHGRNVSAADGEWLPAVERVAVFSCSCCPPNLTRLIASFGGLMYTHGEEGVWVHHYAGGTARFAAQGREITIEQVTNYPEDGRVRLRVHGMRGLTLRLRVPGWCKRATLNVPHTMERGYALIRVDADEAAYELSLAMASEWLEANPRVTANAGRVALRRGPVIYCAEGLDNEVAPQDLVVDLAAPLSEAQSDWHALPDLLTTGLRPSAPEGEWLYRPAQGKLVPTPLRLIPYHATQNRRPTDMQVWLRANR